MGQENILIDSGKIILTNEIIELKEKYKILKDIAMESNKDNKDYIEFLAFEFCKHIEEMIETIHSIK
jgi:hypothetical protein